MRQLHIIGNIHDICVESAAQRTRTIICTFAFKGDFLPCGWQFFAMAPCVRRGGTRTALCPRGRRSSSTGLDVDHAYAETARIGANYFLLPLWNCPTPRPHSPVATWPPVLNILIQGFAVVHSMQTLPEGGLRPGGNWPPAVFCRLQSMELGLRRGEPRRVRRLASTWSIWDHTWLHGGGAGRLPLLPFGLCCRPLAAERADSHR